MEIIFNYPQPEQQFNFWADSDPYEREYVRAYDRVLHEALSQVFRSDNWSNLSSNLVKSMIKQTLEQEPVLSQCFPKISLEKLPLLWLAVLGCYQKSAELLVRCGADVCEFPDGLSTACHPLAIYPKSTVLHALLQLYPSWWNETFIRIIVAENVAILQARDDHGRTPLHYAIKNNRSLQLIEMFLEKRADVNAANSLGATPLHLALKSIQAEELVQLLLQFGANVSAKDERGFNCLHLLAYASNLSAVRAVDLARVLIKKGASLEGRCNLVHDRPIHLAIKIGGSNLQLVETFLEKGADVNAVNLLGETPLHLALESSKDKDLVPLLLQYSVDVSIKNNKGHNVLHELVLVGASHAREERHLKLIAKLLIDKGASLSDPDRENQYQPIHLAALYAQNELIKLFVDHGADVNAPAKDGTFPLWLAAEFHYNTDGLKALLRCGANIHLKRRSDGRTAFHRACEVYNENSIRFLLSAGADILAEDHEGTTPFATMMNNHRGHSDIRLMVLKELAMKKVGLNSSVELKDERTIKSRPELRNKFENCIAEINMMKFTRFMQSCSLFDLLTKSHRQIASFMRNPEFEARFKQIDLKTFPMYAKDIREALERARRHHCKTLEEEKVINEAFYNSLPDVVVRKVIQYVFNDIDCCEDMIDVKCCLIANSYMQLK